MKRFLLLAGTLLIASCSTIEAPDTGVEVSEQHFRIYRGDGSSSDLNELLQEARVSDVTFLGENHNDPVAHYLESLIYESLSGPDLALSLEMFETDVQYVLDEYLSDMISENHLIASGRAWQNYETDYKPMIEYAKVNALPVIAANPPRRYVNMVSREGQQALLDLSEQARQYLPPLPYAGASEAYRERFLALMGMGMNTEPEAGQGEEHGTEEMTQEQAEQAAQAAREQEARLQRMLGAQSLWDAGMAWAIGKHLSENPGSRVVHVNGSFHSAEGLGILDHLRRYRPQTSMLVVTMISGDTFPQFDSENMANLGDFVILTDPALPRSY